MNVSPAELSDECFQTCVLDAVFEGEAGAWLDIEITESALIEQPEALKRLLKKLRVAGVRVAIDDFGAGYSSLGRLAELPVDLLKIDRGFTDRIVESRQNHAIVAAILTLANDCGLTTIAEGVETFEQVAILKSLGCQLCQGYLYSGPITADEMAGLLARQRGPAN
jgi:EAL domain-containing protein (putative c-di-GMP-specific phosphodiesterase class I)